VDIDLEGGGDYSTAAKSTAMFQNIHHAVKSYDARKRINICLPGMTSVNARSAERTGAFMLTLLLTAIRHPL